MKKDLDIVWSKKVRVFHWINALAVIGLIFMGLIMSGCAEYIGINFSKSFIDTMVYWHIGIGAIVAINFISRLFTMFNTKDRGESYKEINVFSKDNIDQLKNMNKEEKGHVYKYHNPIGRFMVFGWFIVLFIQIVTGSILAYEHLSESGMDVASIVITDAYAHGGGHHKPDVDMDMDMDMGINMNIDMNNHANSVQDKDEESLLADIHGYAMYLIIFMLFAHLAGVLKESLRIKENLVSKMIHGYNKNS